MTDELLLKRGYKEYAPTQFHNEYIVKCFQKRFDDDKGKKYFINVDKYDMPEPVTDAFPYEFEVYLSLKDGDAIKMLLYGSDWDINTVEKYIEKLFSTGDYEYYELWEDA